MGNKNNLFCSFSRLSATTVFSVHTCITLTRLASNVPVNVSKLRSDYALSHTTLQTAYQCAWYHLRQLHCSWRELFGVVATTPAGTSEKSKSETSQSSDETNKWTAGEGEGEGEGEEGEEGEDMETEEEEELSSSGKPEKQLESAITVYLRKKCSQKDISPMTKVIDFTTFLLKFL